MRSFNLSFFNHDILHHIHAFLVHHLKNSRGNLIRDGEWREELREGYGERERTASRGLLRHWNADHLSLFVFDSEPNLDFAIGGGVQHRSEVLVRPVLEPFLRGLLVLLVLRRAHFPLHVLRLVWNGTEVRRKGLVLCQCQFHILVERGHDFPQGMLAERFQDVAIVGWKFRKASCP